MTPSRLTRNHRPVAESRADAYWREKTACGRDCLGGLVAVAIVLLALSLF